MPIKADRFKKHERWSGIPVDVQESDAWHWLPDFARSAIVALAGSYNGYNNGGLDLTDARAAELGVNKRKKNLGLELACEIGLIKQTVKAKQTTGKENQQNMHLDGNHWLKFQA